MEGRETLDLRELARARMIDLSATPGAAVAARETWRARMVNEHGSARVFEALAEQLARAGLAQTDVDACRSFAEEERLHGVLCGAVVASLGGEAIAPALARTAMPLHAEVGATEAVLRNVLSVACLAETVAVALIGAERLAMPEGPLRALLTQIYSDEIGHARFGWRLVTTRIPSLDQSARARLSAYLSVAFASLEAHQLQHLPVGACPPPEGAALGLCRGEDGRALFYDTVTEVIVPRLEALGLSAKRAWLAIPSPVPNPGADAELAARESSLALDGSRAAP